MKGYYRKIYLYLVSALAMAVVFFLINSGVFIPDSGQTALESFAEPVDTISADEMEGFRKQVLVLTDGREESSLKYAGNLERVFRWMDMEAEVLDAGRKDTISYADYDLVVVTFSDWEGLIGEDSRRMLDYVERGGRLFLGMLPAEPGAVYRDMYRRMGIIEYGDYYIISGLTFKEELLPGCKGQTFENEVFEDAVLGVQLEERSTLYASGLLDGREIPLIWKHETGEGAILVFNGTAIIGDGWTGVAAGCVASLFDSLIWPVINTKTVFIDDFPSPQYNSDSDVIKEDYNRTVREFYRDIWWPDMQSAAKRYDCDYVGLFIATYDDIVDPQRFSYTKDSVEQYFGNSLLENGYEMGAHGYNHQSLALQGQVPKELGYQPWKDTEDMAASLKELRKIAERLFPGVWFYTYVPPSNYLSAEGRRAVKEALPDLQVLSGVYTKEGEEGSVYVQDFCVAEDGLVEFPRTTSGMLADEYDRFVAMNVAGLYGVFSHFVHPDDILDEERSGGKNWQELFEDFCDKLNFINECYEGLRPMTAVEAAGAVRTADALKTALEVEQGRVSGFCNGFTGEAWCYFRTEKTPVMDNETCRIRPVCSDYEGDYYLIQILDEEFSFLLEE